MTFYCVLINNVLGWGILYPNSFASRVKKLSVNPGSPSVLQNKTGAISSLICTGSVVYDDVACCV